MADWGTKAFAKPKPSEPSKQDLEHIIISYDHWVFGDVWGLWVHCSCGWKSKDGAYPCQEWEKHIRREVSKLEQRPMNQVGGNCTHPYACRSGSPGAELICIVCRERDEAAEKLADACDHVLAVGNFHDLSDVRYGGKPIKDIVVEALANYRAAKGERK